MVNKFLFAFILTLAFAKLNQPLKEFSDTDGPWQLVGVKGYAGTILMNALTGSNLFYWLFESIGGDITKDSRPLVMWLQGGPGCSGQAGMLWENISPIKINQNTQPQYNNNTWALNYHILSVDFPYGAGYSRAGSWTDKKNNTLQATEYLYDFLVKLATKYPSWFDRELYIFGQSYGGHWIPGIAYRIIAQNHQNNTQRLYIPLRGIGMGDPWVDPPTQSQYYSQYSYDTGIINEGEKTLVQILQGGVISNINIKDYQAALNDWEQSYGVIVNYAGGINVYNMRYYKQNYDMGQYPNWLNEASTKTLLHVDLDVTWVSCDNNVYNSYTEDIMTSTIHYLPYIVDNAKVLIYNAQDDLIVNTPGTMAMIASIDWPGIEYFNRAKKTIWKVNGEVAGYAKNYGNMNFVLILKAGHMSPHDQPINARDMVIRYIEDQGFTS